MTWWVMRGTGAASWRPNSQCPFHLAWIIDTQSISRAAATTCQTRSRDSSILTGTPFGSMSTWAVGFLDGNR